MRKEFLNTDGFGLIEVLIAIAVLIVIGGAGAYAYHQDHKTKPATVSSSTNNGTGSTQTGKTTKSTVTPSVQTSYLDITQWGVKVPLSSAITDAYYVVSTSSQGTNGQPNTVWLGIKSLDANGCSASNGNDSKTPILAAIIRVSPTATDPVSGKSEKQLYPNGTTIGRYYYGYSAYAGLDQGSKCSSAANLSVINSAFESAARNIARD